MSNDWFPKRMVLFTVGCLVWTGNAAVRHVPEEYPTIQGAIDVCDSGDVVMVSPGVYFENVRFRAKPITLTSTNPDDMSVVGQTVIHGVGNGSVVSFTRGENSNAVLRGFTITGGYGTANPLFNPTVYWGAAIYCYTSSPTIVGNIIVSNTAAGGGTNATVLGYGAGIGCVGSSAIIRGNWISDNSGGEAAGVASYAGEPTIADNIICSNSAGGVLLANGGALLNNTIVGNGSGAVGNVYVFSRPTSPCVVSGNLICNAASGGGLYLEGEDEITRVTYNNVWNNAGGDYPGGGTPRTGLDGNISQDPEFVGIETNDFHLRDSSPCVNAGDPAFQPAAGEIDFYGHARIYAGQVDMGASEYSDNFRPVANAGPDRAVAVTGLPALIQLAASDSFDPQGTALSFHWRQLSGPAVTLNDAGVATPEFTAPALGTYRFELIVSNSSNGSFPDSVQVTVKNDPPKADPGNDQIYSDTEPIASITLDASLSFDPQQGLLTYRWKQISGWKVELNNPDAMRTTFLHPWPGTYQFELVVDNGLKTSAAVVAIVIGPDQAPVADAGPARYVGRDSMVLDGTRSHGADGHGTLAYHWRQVSGPVVSLSGTNTATPVVSGFAPTNVAQKCVFELVVNDGHLSSSLPSSVTVTVVRNFGPNALVLVNPPFDPARPTIVAFGGGNCTTGGGLTFDANWEKAMNWITVESYGPPYTKYGDMLMVYLSNVAPDYQQPIQAIGWSTGNLPGMDVAWYVNPTYKDPRYSIRRVALLDAVCTDLNQRVAQFSTNRVAGARCWVDNYISNASGFNQAAFIRGAVNIACNPAREHYYPVARYISSSLDYTNGGFAAFGYLSVIGAGRNYELNALTNKYSLKVDSSESLAFASSNVFPGKILAPVELTGPADGATVEGAGVSLSCLPVENAVRYQLLLGTTPTGVADYAILAEGTNPPVQLLSSLPQSKAWWTVKAYDQFGSTIHADPRLIQLPGNRPPLADAGPTQVLVAGADGTASVTLSGERSTDPDGEALSYTWASVIDGKAALANGMSLTLRLPIGVHTVQLMVNDGRANSEPAATVISVIPLFHLAAVVQANSPLRLEFTCLAGQRSILESSTNLTDWIDVDTATAGADGLGHFEVIPDGNIAARFYRARIVP